jgi:hypothetical protein
MWAGATSGRNRRVRSEFPLQPASALFSFVKCDRFSPLRRLFLTNERTRFIFQIIEYGERLRTGLVQPEAEFRESG